MKSYSEKEIIVGIRKVRHGKGRIVKERKDSQGKERIVRRKEG